MAASPRNPNFRPLSDLRATLNTALPLSVGYGLMLIGFTVSIMLGRPTAVSNSSTIL